MLANLPDTFVPLELSTPPEFTGIPRKPILTPGGGMFYCPCCPIELARPMMEMKKSILDEGSAGTLPFKVVFQCVDCKCVLTAKRVPGIRTYRDPIRMR